MTSSCKTRFLFEDYALDTDRRELRRGLALLPVEPQVFDLLIYVIRNRDRVVSKDDLLASVWGGRIVSEIDDRQPDQRCAPRARRQWRTATADPHNHRQGCPLRGHGE